MICFVMVYQHEPPKLTAAAQQASFCCYGYFLRQMCVFVSVFLGVCFGLFWSFKICSLTKLVGYTNLIIYRNFWHPTPVEKRKRISVQDIVWHHQSTIFFTFLKLYLYINIVIIIIFFVIIVITFPELEYKMRVMFSIFLGSYFWWEPREKVIAWSNSLLASISLNILDFRHHVHLFLVPTTLPTTISLRCAMEPAALHRALPLRRAACSFPIIWKHKPNSLCTQWFGRNAVFRRPDKVIVTAHPTPSKHMFDHVISPFSLPFWHHTAISFREYPSSTTLASTARKWCLNGQFTQKCLVKSSFIDLCIVREYTALWIVCACMLCRVTRPEH